MRRFGRRGGQPLVPTGHAGDPVIKASVQAKPGAGVSLGEVRARAQQRVQRNCRSRKPLSVDGRSNCGRNSSGSNSSAGPKSFGNSSRAARKDCSRANKDVPLSNVMQFRSGVRSSNAVSSSEADSNVVSSSEAVRRKRISNAISDNVRFSSARFGSSEVRHSVPGRSKTRDSGQPVRRFGNNLRYSSKEPAVSPLNRVVKVTHVDRAETEIKTRGAEEVEISA